MREIIFPIIQKPKQNNLEPLPLQIEAPMAPLPVKKEEKSDDSERGGIIIQIF